MRQRVKPWTRWHGGILVPSMSGVGTVTLPVPDAPVIAADTISSSSIEITRVSGEGDVFEIERSLNGSDWTQISSDATFPYAATGLSASTLYYFRARAQFTGGPWSAWSEVVSDTTEAAAEPGDLVHGELATIEGSGFGAVASPVRLYDDFSTGTINALVRSTAASGVGSWQTGAGDDLVTRSDLVTRGVHSRVARHNFRASGGGYNASLCLNQNFSGTWLFDWWQRVDPVAGAPSSWTRNFKGFRFWMDNGDDGRMVITWIGPGTNVQTQFYTYIGNPYVGIPLTAGQWRHWRLRWNLGASYSNDVVHLSSAAAGSTFTTHYNGGFRAAGSASRYPYEMRLGHYWAHDAADGFPSNPGADIYTSSVLVQNTWARVELGNHAAYASATITEAQHTLSRSNTAIEYRVNKGALPSGTVHEYVFDASNNLVKTTEKTLS